MTLRSAATPNPTDLAATTRAYAAYVEAVVQRGVAQLNFTVETISEMSPSAVERVRARFANGADAGAAAVSTATLDTHRQGSDKLNPPRR